MVQKQSRYAAKVALLILEAIRRGHLVAGGEWLRPPVTAAYYASVGKGIKDSLHLISLGFDLKLFTADGTYLTQTDDYRELGEWWESQSEPDLRLCWGGAFGDGNHFSAENNGIR